MDISHFDIDQLLDLRDRVEKELHSRREKEREHAIKQIREIAEKAGLSLNEVLTKQKSGRAKSAGVGAKYRNPEDSSQTWSGRGRRPKWVDKAIAAGQSIEDLAI